MKRKRPEESTLFNDINNDSMGTPDGVSLITPSSNPFNLVSPKSLLPTFLKQDQNNSGRNGTPTRPFPTLDTPPTQNSNGNSLISPGLFLPPNYLSNMETPTEIGGMNSGLPVNEQQVFSLFDTPRTTPAPPFGTSGLQTPGFDIPTPLLTNEGHFPPHPDTQKSIQTNGHQPPPPPTDTATLPPLPRPIPKRHRPATPDTPENDDEDEEDDDSNTASHASGNASTFFRIAEGLNKNSNVKYLGGKQNNQYPMPPQTLEVDWNKMPRVYMDQYGVTSIHQLICRAFVLGFDRQKRSMVSLGRISSDKRFHETPDGRWVAVFNDIFVQYASHNYGQRLALRFHLVMINNDGGSDDDRVLCQADSTEFQTITKRGLEKEQQRERNRIEKHKYGAVVESVEPSIGFPVGNQLVKIYLSGMVGDSSTSTANTSQLSNSQVSVFFGDQQSPEIHSVKKNVIVCETPEHVPGTVDVVVSLVKKDNVGTCLTSKAKFRFVDPNDREAPLLVLKHYSMKAASPLDA
jgi:hypothetical protein